MTDDAINCHARSSQTSTKFDEKQCHKWAILLNERKEKIDRDSVATASGDFRTAKKLESEVFHGGPIVGKHSDPGMEGSLLYYVAMAAKMAAEPGRARKNLKRHESVTIEKRFCDSFPQRWKLLADGEVRNMKDKDTKILSAYDGVEHWPPCTYRDYPDITPRNLHSFLNFLGTENTSREKKELQPWIPFCNSKCTFCYFPTEPFSKDRMERYLSALKKALKTYSETRYVRSSEFNEIYCGGGTPTLMTSEQIASLLSCCERNFNISGDRVAKITGCTYGLNKKKLQSMADYGVDQLDLGIQTFDDDLRKMLNLQDYADEAEQTVKTARKVGLRVSIDLMYNLPGHTMEMWRKDIQKSLDLNVESVDCYPLEIIPNTTLAKQLQSGEVQSMGDSDTETKMYLEAYKMFAESGYEPTCHNRFSRMADDFKEPCFEILGTGAGFFMGHLGKYSYVDIAPASAYINAVESRRFPIAKLSQSSREDEMRKMMMRLYLRLTVDKKEFRRRFGNLPEEVFRDAISRLKKKGLIEVNDWEIRLTKLGDVWRVNIAWEFIHA